MAETMIPLCLVSRSFEGHLRSFQGHLRSFFHIFQVIIKTIPHKLFSLFISSKYTVNDVLSGFIYIFMIIFNFLLDKLMTVHQSQNLFFKILFYIFTLRWRKMDSSGNQGMPLNQGLPTMYNVAYLSSKL